MDDRLHDFYLPALERSVLYRRATGYFTSESLAVAAAGVGRLVENGGSMQLLCGAQLVSEDVDAVLRGESLRDSVVERAMLRGFDAKEANDDEADPALKRRLEILAWLVAHERLEIRVVLPKGPDGNPVAAPDSQEYYHPKEGIFTDAEGNQLAFTGSVNESKMGWRHNFETFHVFVSWPRRAGPETLPADGHHITPIERRFEALWEGDDVGWIALRLPRAVRERLLKYAPKRPPKRDPFERPRTEKPRAVFRFLRAAPFMPNAARLGVETSAVTPWPHQDRVIDAVVDRYPRSFLFCDEVGLGKTIEAGLALRQLVVSGRVRRSLILAPKSVVRQWQEELWEKCALNIPRYEDGALVDVHGRSHDPDGPPWGSVPHLIASSQLAKRKARRDEVLAPEWDLVLVDEAHHARRREFGGASRRPNHLLQLLGGHGGRPGLKDRTRCLYLLTATPMQVSPIEVWDLLKLLGLAGRWGAVEEHFVRFFRELRNPFSQRSWTFLLEMTKDYLETIGEIDPGFAEKARHQLGPVTWSTIRTLPDTIKSHAVIRDLDDEAKAILEGMTRHHTPIRSFVWRNNRDLLHRYRERGILSERVPKRDPQNEWIDFTPEEEDLYDRIEEYITEFYRKYEDKRAGLGFVMTVYRRRLTSSFHAARESLERRRAFLRGEEDASAPRGFVEEDLEQEDLGMDVAEGLGMPEPSARDQELAYLDDFISELNQLTVDSKLEFLKAQLTATFRTRDSVILFTQYTDTMDYLRESLRAVYGPSIACYSGRGGESWDGERWILRRKEDIKEEFRTGDTINVLVCTESASEGLNLQTCGVLINYDMPWNPMRVEQRIGRIDRIGQKYDVVRIHNYFFSDTVEALVYERLKDRIGWFEHVVGDLQPILHGVGRKITELAMTKPGERDIEGAISDIEEQVDALDPSAFDLNALVDETVGGSFGRSPVALADIERAFFTSDLTRHRFTPHPSIPDAFWLSGGPEARAVTFRRSVFDRHPDTVELMSYGNPTFDALLKEVADPRSADPKGSSDPAGAAMLLRDHEYPPVAVSVMKDARTVQEVDTAAEYDEAIRREAQWSSEDREKARMILGSARARADEDAAHAATERRAAQLRALREEARQVLVRSAHIVEVQEGFFTSPAASGIDVLCERGVPYLGLRSILDGAVPVLDPADPYRLDLAGKAPATLTRRLTDLKRQGLEVLERYAAWRQKGR